MLNVFRSDIRLL